MTTSGDTPPGRDDRASGPRHDHPAGLGDEPAVEVPAGLLGTAVELLDLCDQLLNHPGHDAIDAQVHALMRRWHAEPVTASQWLHTALAATAADLQRHLDDRYIIVEPTIAGRRPRPAG